MEHVWANFAASQVYRSDNWTMLKTSLHWFAAAMFGGLGVRNPASLLDNAPLRELLTQQRALRRHPRERSSMGISTPLAVTASAYATARSVTFFQGAARARRRGRACAASAAPRALTIDHLMASAAVPFVFPPVQIGGEFYGDGSMRHRAPLSPAIHLGADRMLVVGVRDERPDAEPPRRGKPEPPTFAHLGGYMLDTLFMDGLYTDLERLSRTNRILEQLGDAQADGHAGGLRPLHTLVIVPQPGPALASRREFVHELPRGVRLLLRGLGASSNSGMQLVSYLLFESGFTRALIDMGYRDAMEMEDELRAFLFDQPMATLYAPAHLKLALER